jgi:methionyl-tRNA formyltransferase
MSYIIFSSQNWHPKLADNLRFRTHCEIHIMGDKAELTTVTLRNIHPEKIFFPHWSFVIPAEIYENYECVIFHMTDLPFGRGGSPLQNLISRGIYETQISAIRCVKDLDAGDIYLKRPLSLYGSAEEIYIRANQIIEEMIVEIIQEKPVSEPQIGEVVNFKRRKPEEGNIATLDSLDKVFDYIRMLDAESYPKAFFETEHLRFEFSRASMKVNHVVADVRITVKNADEQ